MSTVIQNVALLEYCLETLQPDDLVATLRKGTVESLACLTDRYDAWELGWLERLGKTLYGRLIPDPSRPLSLASRRFGLIGVADNAITLSNATLQRAGFKLHDLLGYAATEAPRAQRTFFEIGVQGAPGMPQAFSGMHAYGVGGKPNIPINLETVEILVRKVHWFWPVLATTTAAGCLALGVALYLDWRNSCPRSVPLNG